MPYFIATLASVSPKWNMCVVYPSLCSKDTRLVLSTSGADLESTAGSRDSMPTFCGCGTVQRERKEEEFHKFFFKRMEGRHSIWKKIWCHTHHYSRYWEVVLLSVCDVYGDKKWPMGSFFWLFVGWHQSKKKSKFKQQMKIEQQDQKRCQKASTPILWWAIIVKKKIAWLLILSIAVGRLFSINIVW